MSIPGLAVKPETERLILKARKQAASDGRLRFVYRGKIGLKQPKGWGWGTVYAVGADDYATIPEPGDKWGDPVRYA